MVLLLILLFSLAGAQAQGENATLKIPPQRIAFDIKGQPVGITAWGEVSRLSAGDIGLALTADLSDLQRNIAPLLGTQLNRSDRCGERMSVESASMESASPAANLTVRVHYERWGCAKVLGKELVKRLVGGNGVVTTRITPYAGKGGISVTSEVQKIEADGSLGELLQAGSVGASIKEKIADSIQSAIRKAGNFDSILPVAIASAVQIRSIQFTEGEGGRLWLALRADASLSPDQFQILAGQLRR